MHSCGVEEGLGLGALNVIVRALTRRCFLAAPRWLLALPLLSGQAGAETTLPLVATDNRAMLILAVLAAAIAAAVAACFWRRLRQETAWRQSTENDAADAKRRLNAILNNAGVDLLADTMKKTIDVNKVIYADSKENRLIPDLKLRGISGIVAVNKPAGSVMAGIKLMQDYKIIVHPDSKNIATELNNYVWKNGIPIDLYNHRIDAIRYYVQSVIKSSTRRTVRAA